jgi:transposase
MMGTKVRSFSPLPHDISLEDLVPQDNFYRRLQARLDLSFVRELVGPLYANGGRPSVDPVIFFKLQLVMFFEDIRSERQLMGVVSDRLSLRWYLGYDLHEPLPDHSSLTRIRERYGLLVFRRFFERIVEECIEAGLVWGEELFFDATKVEANASMESRVPRFSAEAHLGGLFGEEEEEAAETGAGEETSEPSAEADLDALLPAASDRGLRAENAKRDDWISRKGKPDRTIVRGGYRRKSDYEVSLTDPDASLMQHKRGASRMGYHAHYVVDGGKARVILSALVTPADVTENQPMLDLLWRTIFRWRARVRRVTGDAKYGTKEIVAAVEKASIRAYVSMADFESRSPYYGSSRFHYDAEQDLYRCPRGEPLRLYTHSYTERLSRYRADPESCNACPLKPECTPGDSGRVLMRSFEELLERVRAYRGTAPYEKALRKRKVWVEPMFGEAKEWHGMRRFRLRRLWRVNAEAMVTAAGQNIKRLLTFSGRGPRKLAQVEALRPPAPTSWANGRLLQGSHRRRSTPLLARFSTRWGVLRSRTSP